MNETDLLDAPTSTDESGESSPAPSLRETIEAAVDAQGEAGEVAQQPPADKQPDSQQPPVAAEPPTTTADKPAVVATELKAPAQWKPAVREKWNQLPREVQEEVLRRESDSMRLIGSVGQKIRMADEVQGHLQPFVEKLHQNGVNPSAFIGDVFTTVKSLSSGSLQEKADVVANIIQAYGVDLRMLDNILSQRLQQPPEVMEARRLAARAQSVLQERDSSVEQQTAVQAERHLASFAADPKHEFLDDVRDLMADLIESGRATNLSDAYTAAIWAKADTRKILLQRESEARVAAKQNRAQHARTASLSVGGAPRTAGSGPHLGSNMSLRDTIAAAMDAQDAA